jgi:hypothetical protein
VTLLADHRTEVRRLVLLVAIYAIPIVAAVGPVSDPDVWSHLRTGQWMVEHGSVPMTDPFSAVALGKPWVAYSWLFELLIYGLYRIFDLTGLVVYTAAMTLLVAVAIHRLVRPCRMPFIEETALLGLALCGFLPLVSPRPWLFTILFFVLELDIILTVRRGARAQLLWLLPPLFLVWANLHIQFVYGLLILGLAAIEPLVARTARLEARAAMPSTRTWVVVTIACLIATLATPYHVRLYGEILDNVVQSRRFTYIGEFHPLAIDSIGNWAVLILTCLAWFVVGRSRRVDVFGMLLILAGVILSFRSSRDTWVVNIASVGIIATLRGAPAREVDRLPLGTRQLAILACSMAFTAIVTGLNRQADPRGLAAALAEDFPMAASAVIEERGYQGPMYNHYNWGGYLIWRLPRLPVSVDGRALLYGGERIERQMKTWAGESDWRSDPDLLKAGLVILPARLPLASLLRVDSSFQVAYEDKVAVVFVRSIKTRS